jgi:hypothetical protein
MSSLAPPAARSAVFVRAGPRRATARSGEVRPCRNTALRRDALRRASISVPESVSDPVLYYGNNVTETLELAAAAAEACSWR